MQLEFHAIRVSVHFLNACIDAALLSEVCSASLTESEHVTLDQECRTNLLNAMLHQCRHPANALRQTFQ